MIKPATVDDILGINLQEGQAYCREYLDDGYADILVANTTTMAITSPDDTYVLGCIGMYRIYDHRADIWMVIDQDAGRHMVYLIKQLKKLLDFQQIRRIECSVDSDFPEGRRMVELLGFTCETPKPLIGYGKTGKDCYLYSLIRNEF